ncbi:cell division protein FtsL [Catenovulum sp. SM1970]|uniref:cell division protein FtsL n=1 Tax=Marinifaba aquimaris TaxID=2741323 RepID=UPI001572DAF4|nr:cell division protein FtsL [Marinifaba aquimaris]NTS76594.1 cell division protein FtsL [Marinifaba aquimaris]
MSKESKQDKTVKPKKDKSKQPNLAWVIMSDWWAHKVIIVLILAVLTSAYSVIYFAWKNRDLNTQLQQLQDEQDTLDVDWRHMLLEHNALSEHSRVEKVARKQMQMKRPERKDEVVITAE